MENTIQLQNYYTSQVNVVLDETNSQFQLPLGPTMLNS